MLLQYGLIFLITYCGKIFKIKTVLHSTDFFTIPSTWANKDFIVQGTQYNVKQFLLECHQRCHPNHSITQLETPSIGVRKDLCIYEENIRNVLLSTTLKEMSPIPRMQMTCRSPTDHCRNQENQAAKKNSGSGITEVGMEH